MLQQAAGSQQAVPSVIGDKNNYSISQAFPFCLSYLGSKPEMLL